MKNSSPKKGRRDYHVRVPLEEAAEIVGDGDRALGMKRLEADADNINTWRTWQRPMERGGGVPGYRLVRTLVVWWQKRRTLIVEAERRGYERAHAEIDAMRRARDAPGPSGAARGGR